MDLSGFDVEVIFDVDESTIASLKQRTAVPTNRIFQLKVSSRLALPARLFGAHCPHPLPFIPPFFP